LVTAGQTSNEIQLEDADGMDVDYDAEEYEEDGHGERCSLSYCCLRQALCLVLQLLPIDPALQSPLPFQTRSYAGAGEATPRHSHVQQVYQSFQGLPIRSPLVDGNNVPQGAVGIPKNVANHGFLDSDMDELGLGGK
jgi:hypothetical protein